MTLTNRNMTAAIVALGATALAAWAPPAIAAGSDDRAVAAGRAAEEAAAIATSPMGGDVRFGEEQSSTVVASGHDVDVTAPVNADGPVLLGTAGEGPDLLIDIPISEGAADAEVVNGDVVYIDEQSDTSFVLDARSGGARIMAVLNSAEADHVITYDFNLPSGVELQALPDGTVLAVDADEGPLAVVKPAWAVDARGRSVATRYVVEGDVLTQIIEPSSEVAYPVVADPTVEVRWYGYTFYFNRSETQTVATGGAPCVYLLSRVPYAGGALAGFCILYGAVAADALARGRCLRVNWGWTVNYPWHGTC
jgi:hypothetical protein